jgi:hypothetical protein
MQEPTHAIQKAHDNVLYYHNFMAVSHISIIGTSLHFGLGTSKQVMPGETVRIRERFASSIGDGLSAPL